MSKIENAPEQSAKNKFSRQIDSAFEEASKLAGSSFAPTEFYEKFLNIAMGAIDAPAGVVWLRTPQGFLQIACQLNLDKVGLDAKRGGRQCHNEILRQVFQATPARPVMVEPQGRLTGVTNTEPGSVPAANLTDYYTLFAPIVNQEKQPFGLLELFHDPALDPRMYQTFLQYTTQMAGYASQYHQFSNARQSAGLEKVFAQVEAFAKQVHSSLNPTEVAYHVANEGRRLIECDRLCVGVRHGKKVTVEAVSGADVVEKASTHVRRMKNLFDAVLKFGDRLVYKGEKDEGLPPDVSHALDEYLSESQPKLLVVTPVRDDREKDNGRPARSVLLMESFNPPEKIEPLIQKLDLVTKHAAGALYNAAEMKRVPFGFIWRPLGKIQEGLGGKNRFYIALGVAAVAILAAVMVLVPYPLKVEAKGEFLPQVVVQAYAPTEGEVRDFLYKPGDRVKPNAKLISLFSPTFQEKYMKASGELMAAQGKVDGYRTVLAQKSLPANDELNLRREIAKESATVESQRAFIKQLTEIYNMVPGKPGEFNALAPRIDLDRSIPFQVGDYLVLNSDNRDQLKGRTVKPNEPLMRLGMVDGPWRVELKIPQRNIGHIAHALATEGMHNKDKDGKKYLDVDVLLASETDTSYPGRLYQEDLAAEAVPNKDDHNESEPVVQAYVRVDQEDGRRIPLELRKAGVEARTRVRCGPQPLGYSLFHGVWEWFYEKVVFFF
ncbi:efflux RND transporter periplasmic adaptor subunit [Fimbriiglobus ruber]|uniref:Uncharacterized protein n=1 Tax=Fimbriiglobus ruber TaxID=1908690 RepID=A0A225CYM9_9BACT|nr:efflux RND transporter periplasmic adaptor subunit [Fimbriiglobus ruber]OWK34451.1 hypothetical protein FRUB_10422 [Fimbriiglobus ruber]